MVAEGNEVIFYYFSVRFSENTENKEPFRRDSRETVSVPVRFSHYPTESGGMVSDRNRRIRYAGKEKILSACTFFDPAKRIFPGKGQTKLHARLGGQLSCGGLWLAAGAVAIERLKIGTGENGFGQMQS